ncbi:Crp/Fnr family transcriptional regulator [Methylobacterium marchantiae]|uniref:Crp/Fnr family transcriptional regulator n=1 Tax=Methylobacterium marchantiae TaxID=600331 RepID=A0ABW3WXY5_9HYPH|nr:hypothetical protein AIGOOFII_1111 [Methylobacterium marchantiae]
MTYSIVQSEIRNRLLRGLLPSEFERLQPHLNRISLEPGIVVEKPDRPIATVYFPEPGVISVVARTLGGTQAEAGIVGPEGMTGLAILHGLDRSPNTSLVQMACRAIAIDARVFRGLIEERRPLHDHLLRYAQVFAVQLAQASLCNGRFTIEQRLARWLLMCHDRADREDLPLTHELLSLMLGVRRAGVTTALRSMEALGAVKTRRGGINLRDRDALERAAGEAYGVPEAEYERVLG